MPKTLGRHSFFGIYRESSEKKPYTNITASGRAKIFAAVSFIEIDKVYST